MFYLCKGWSPLSWRNFYIKEILQDYWQDYIFLWPLFSILPLTNITSASLKPFYKQLSYHFENMLKKGNTKIRNEPKLPKTTQNMAKPPKSNQIIGKPPKL